MREVIWLAVSRQRVERMTKNLPDLLPVCRCGATMAHVVTKPTGGGFKDHMECKACGSTGFVRRDA